MSKLRVCLEVDSAAMNEMLTSAAQREQLGEALVNTVWRQSRNFSDGMTLGFYGIKTISIQEIDDSVAITPTPARGWLIFAAMRDWIRTPL